ncbi:hypothetical protein P7C70_g5364, partial [Phenoliferia sp. Uapishka_3]
MTRSKSKLAKKAADMSSANPSNLTLEERISQGYPNWDEHGNPTPRFRVQTPGIGWFTVFDHGEGRNREVGIGRSSETFDYVVLKKEGRMTESAMFDILSMPYQSYLEAPTLPRGPNYICCQTSDWKARHRNECSLIKSRNFPELERLKQTGQTSHYASPSNKLPSLIDLFDSTIPRAPSTSSPPPTDRSSSPDPLSEQSDDSDSYSLSEQDQSYPEADDPLPHFDTALSISDPSNETAGSPCGCGHEHEGEGEDGEEEVRWESNYDAEGNLLPRHESTCPGVKWFGIYDQYEKYMREVGVAYSPDTCDYLIFKRNIRVGEFLLYDALSLPYQIYSNPPPLPKGPNYIILDAEADSERNTWNQAFEHGGFIRRWVRLLQR